jgi:ankyrin repeat protein
MAPPVQENRSRSADMGERARSTSAPPSLAGKPLSALLGAASAGDLDATRAALATGEDLEAVDAQGRTALMRAAALGHTAVVRLLLDAGASSAHTDLHGLTAADLARRGGHEAVLALLRP